MTKRRNKQHYKKSQSRLHKMSISNKWEGFAQYYLPASCVYTLKCFPINPFGHAILCMYVRIGIRYSFQQHLFLNRCISQQKIDSEIIGPYWWKFQFNCLQTSSIYRMAYLSLINVQAIWTNLLSFSLSPKHTDEYTKD